MWFRTIDDIRKAWGGEWENATDEQVLSAYAEATKTPVHRVANMFRYEAEDLPKTGWVGRAFEAAGNQYVAGLQDVGAHVAGALGLKGVSEYLDKRRQTNEIAAGIDAARAAERGAVQSLDDVHSASDFGAYLANFGINSAPFLGEMAVFAALSAAAPQVGLPAAAYRLGQTGRYLYSAKELRDIANAARAIDASKSAVEAGQIANRIRALNRGAWITGGTYGTAVGGVLGSQREESGETDPATAFLLGVPSAMLNAVTGVGSLISRGGLARNAVSLLDDARGVTGAALRTGATMVRTGIGEAVNETGQEMLNQMGRIAVNPDAEMFGPEALARYKESAIGGGLLGGMFGAAGGWRRSQAYHDARLAEARDLLNRKVVETKQPTTDWLPGFDVGAATAEAAPERGGSYTRDQLEQLYAEKVVLENGLKDAEARGDTQWASLIRGALKSMPPELDAFEREMSREQAEATSHQLPLFGGGPHTNQQLVLPGMRAARDLAPMETAPVETTLRELQGQQQAVEYAMQQAEQQGDWRKFYDLTNTRKELQAKLDYYARQVSQPSVNGQLALFDAAGEPSAEVKTAEKLAKQRVTQQEKAEREAAKQRAAQEKAQRDSELAAKKARLEQFGVVPTKKSIELFDQLEALYGLGGVNNQAVFDDQVNTLAVRKYGAVKTHIDAALSTKKVAADGGVQNVSGPEPVGRGVYGGADAQRSVAPAGRAVGAANTGAGDTGAPAGRSAAVVAEPAGQQAGSGAVAAKLQVRPLKQDGKQYYELTFGDRTIKVPETKFNRLRAVMGFDRDGAHSGQTRTASEAAAYLNRTGGDGSGKPVTEAKINNTLREYGIKLADVKAAFNAPDTSYLSPVVNEVGERTDADAGAAQVAVTGSTNDAEDSNPGMRVVSNVNQLDADTEAAAALATLERRNSKITGKSLSPTEIKHVLQSSEMRAIRKAADETWAQPVALADMPDALRAKFYLQVSNVVAAVRDGVDWETAQKEITQLQRDITTEYYSMNLKDAAQTDAPTRFSQSADDKIEVEVETARGVLRFADAQGAVVKLQDVIDRHLALLNCLRR